MTKLAISSKTCTFPRCASDRRPLEPFCEAHWMFMPPLLKNELHEAVRKMRDGMRTGDVNFSASLHRYVAVCHVGVEAIAAALQREFDATANCDYVSASGRPDMRKIRVIVDGAEVRDVLALDVEAGWVKTLKRDDKNRLILLDDARVATRRIESNNIRVEKRA